MAQRGSTTALAGGNGAAAPPTPVTRTGRGPAPTRRLITPPARVKGRLPELVVGVLLVAGGALGAVMWATHEPSQRVLVANEDIPRGVTIDVSMLRWASVTGDHLAGVVDPVVFDDAALGLDGHLAAIEIPEGTPVLASALRSAARIGIDQTEYGMALDPGDYPTGLATGDEVLVVVVPPADTSGTPAAAVTLTETAQVLAVPSPELAPGEKAVVTVLVQRADVGVLATAADIRLARVAGG